MLNPNDEGQLFLDAGEETEDFIKFIRENLDEATRNEINVKRIQHKTDLASEPITIGVVLFLGGVTIYQVGRLLEKWIEKVRQDGVRRDLILAWDKNPKLAKVIADVEKQHSGIVVSQGMPNFKDLDSGWIGSLPS